MDTLILMLRRVKPIYTELVLVMMREIGQQ